MTPKSGTAEEFLGSLGRALCYLLLFLVSRTLVTMVYTSTIRLYAMLNPGSGINPIELISACTDQISIVSGVATLVILAAFFLLRRKNPLKESGILRTHGRFVFTAAAVTPILYSVICFVLGLLPEAWLESYAQASAALNRTGILTAIAAVILVPILEEVIFRGLILSRLNRALPGWLSVLLSALLFGVCHVHPLWMAYAFALGVVFGFMDLRARSIWPSLIAHSIFNGIGQLSVYLPETEQAGLLFLATLAAIGVVLCIIVLIYRRTRPLNQQKMTL